MCESAAVAPYLNWTVEDVADWIEKIGFSFYKVVDGEDLVLGGDSKVMYDFVFTG